MYKRQIIKRCEGKVDAEETAIGFVPKAEDINLEGIEEFYAKFGDRLPKALSDELNTLKANLEK